MPEIETHNVVVIGSGEAGKHLAWTLAGVVQRSAVVARRYIEGSSGQTFSEMY